MVRGACVYVYVFEASPFSDTDIFPGFLLMEK